MAPVHCNIFFHGMVGPISPSSCGWPDDNELLWQEKLLSVKPDFMYTFASKTHLSLNFPYARKYFCQTNFDSQ